jgi:hypothetical protein
MEKGKRYQGSSSWAKTEAVRSSFPSEVPYFIV